MNQNSGYAMPVASTRFSDPRALWQVCGLDIRRKTKYGFGGGVMGYYVSVEDARTVARWLRRKGCKRVRIEANDPSY